MPQGKQSLVVHIGRFVDGQRSGPGVVTSSRGERFEGYFHEDVMWGPGEYRYALPVVASGSDGYSSSGSTGHAAEAPEAAGGGDGGSATAGAEPSTGAAGPPPAPPPQPHRVCYRGMLNGKPQGKGCMEWSNGRQQAGQVGARGGGEGGTNLAPSTCIGAGWRGRRTICSPCIAAPHPPAHLHPPSPPSSTVTTCTCGLSMMQSQEC